MRLNRVVGESFRPPIAGVRTVIGPRAGMPPPRLAFPLAFLPNFFSSLFTARLFFFTSRFFNAARFRPRALRVRGTLRPPRASEDERRASLRRARPTSQGCRADARAGKSRQIGRAHV